MIQVSHLTKMYGPRTAINDLSFEVKKGEIVGFLGPNGAGKSTTMKILTGFMPATSGKADDRRLRRLRESDRGQAQRRLPSRNPARLSGDAGRRLSRLRGAAPWRGQGQAQGRRIVRDRKDRPRRRPQTPDRQPLQGLPSTRGPRAGARAQSAGPDPRRTHRRPRPQADHRDPRADQEPGAAITPSS